MSSASPPSVTISPPLTPRTPGCWLFLQGLGTPFNRILAAKIGAAGGRVVRIDYSGGDWFFGGEEPRIKGNEGAGRWPQFYKEVFDAYDPEGIILFGDQRPVHKGAVQLAKEQGRTVLCIEEGYLRPGWITVEHGGTNAASLIPQTAEALVALAAPQADPAYIPIRTNMRNRVKWDLQHKGMNIWLNKQYQGYETHRPYPMHREARGWIGRLWNRPKMRRHREVVMARYKEKKPRFFLLPLQLNSDTQMRVHADVGGVPGFIETALTSFAAHAPKGTKLLIKNHPLDNGVLNYASLVAFHAAALGVSDRVDYIDGGDLEAMLAACAGVVLVNSTVGLLALKASTPVSAHGKAIYKIDGLTDPQPLDGFWHSPEPPKTELVTTLLNTLKAGCMVEGDLFSDDGIERGTQGVLEIITGIRPRLVKDPGGTVRLGPCCL